MSWVGSLINVGAIVGCLAGGALMDRFGRKMILAAVFLLFTTGWLFIMLAVDPSNDSTLSHTWIKFNKFCVQACSTLVESSAESPEEYAA